MDDQNQNYNPYGYEESAPRKKRNFAVPFAIVIAGLFVGAAIFVTQGGFQNQGAAVGSSNADGQLHGKVPPPDQNDHILGNPNAPIVIIEYSDTECPYCKNFHDTMHMVINEYGTAGKVAWIYRHFPIEGLHKKSPKEAEATECAYSLGGNQSFWSYIDMIFKKTPSNDQLDLSLLPKFAEDIGLDPTAFESCLASGKYTAQIKEAFDAAVAAGATGTPTSFILFGGQSIPVEGAQSFASISTVVKNMLAQGQTTEAQAPKTE